MVVTEQPSTFSTGRRHERAALPSTWTAHVQHSPQRSHPSFVPVRPRSRCSTSMRRSPGSGSSRTGCPLRRNVTGRALIILPFSQKVSWPETAHGPPARNNQEKFLRRPPSGVMHHLFRQLNPGWKVAPPGKLIRLLTCLIGCRNARVLSIRIRFHAPQRGLRSHPCRTETRAPPSRKRTRVEADSCIMASVGDL